MNTCNCTTGKRNTASNTCPTLSSIARRIIIVPKFKADGTVNQFATEASVTKAALQAKFDAADIDDRFFPLAEFVNVVNERAEEKYETYTDDSKNYLRDGVRSFTGYLTLQDSRLQEKLKTWRCQEFGVYIIDKNSNFRYLTDLSTHLLVKPIAVDNESLIVRLIEATDTTVAKLMISFDFASNVDDELLRYIAVDNLDFDGLDTADVYGLYDVNATLGTISTTDFHITLTTDYGLPVKGLVAGDFALYNVTDSASIAIATAPETADGVYNITWIAAATPTDVVRLTPTKSHYDFANVVATVITIP